jgi:hypothetical protein
MKKHNRMNSSWDWMLKSAIKKSPLDDADDKKLAKCSALIESAKITGYTFKTRSDTNEGDILIVAYKGQKIAGHISALEYRGNIKSICKDDFEKAKKAVGRKDVKVFQVWNSHVFTKKERGEEHRGIGVGSAMYAKMIEEVGKRGAILISGECTVVGSTSKKAKDLWNNSNTIRRIAHVFGNVAAWKGIANLTEKDERKNEAMRTMQRRWIKTPSYLRSKSEFRDWGANTAGYDPGWIEDFLKNKKEEDVREKLHEKTYFDDLKTCDVSRGSTKCVKPLDPKGEIKWHDSLEARAVSTDRKCKDAVNAVHSEWIKEVLYVGDNRSGDVNAISESKESDVLKATRDLKGEGLTDKFWRAHSINSKIYHQKMSRFYASEEDTVCYAGKVSEVLISEVLKYVANSAHNVPVYVTYRIRENAAYGKWKDKYAIFVRPGPRVWMLWFILHEIKHAIDSASKKDTLKEPDLSTPEKFRAYKKHPSERRAEAFAKRVIMLVAAESGPSLIEATRMFS